MTTLDTVTLTNVQKETDSLGEVDVPADVLWGAQTQRSLDQFSIGHDLIPRETITSYATLKKAATNVNHAAGRLSDRARERSFEMSLGVDRSRRTAVTAPSAAWRSSRGYDSQGRGKTLEAASSADCSRTLAFAISRSAFLAAT